MIFKISLSVLKSCISSRKLGWRYSALAGGERVTAPSRIRIPANPVNKEWFRCPQCCERVPPLPRSHKRSLINRREK